MKKPLMNEVFSCDHWNRVPVSKIFLEQPSQDPKVRVMILMYEPIRNIKM